jgi:hypothetical protein
MGRNGAAERVGHLTPAPHPAQAPAWPEREPNTPLFGYRTACEALASPVPGFCAPAARRRQRRTRAGSQALLTPGRPLRSAP